MSFKIVEGSSEGLERVADINQRIFEDMYREDPYSLKQIRDRLEGKKSYILLAEKDDKTVGYSVSYGEGEEFYIWLMGVLEEYRGQEIGRELLGESEAKAVEEGFEKITTKVYNVSKPMQALLIKQGYDIVDVDNDENPLYNAVHFEKDISSPSS